MDIATSNDLPLGQKQRSGVAGKVHGVLLVLFLAQFVLLLAELCFPQPWLPSGGWPEDSFAVLATMTLMAALSRNLPLQNVVMASAIIAFIGSAMTELGAIAGLPFGFPVHHGHVAWELPLVWIVFVLSSRNVARLALQPWRSVTNYGLRVIGLTTALVVWLGFGLESQEHSLQVALNWRVAPWLHALAWAATTLAILAFATPMLLNKKPVPPPPPEISPLIVWLSLNLLFGIGCAMNRLWLATGVIFVGAAVAGFFAMRGARFCSSDGFGRS